MADVQKPHPKRDEFVCGGCHMTITAEAVNALMTRDELQTCNNCGRILYLQQAGHSRETANNERRGPKDRAVAAAT